MRAVETLYAHIPTSERPATDPLTFGQQLREAVEQEVYSPSNKLIDIEPDFAQCAVQGLHTLGFSNVDHELGAAIFEALRIRIVGSRHVFFDVFATLAELQRRGFLLGIVTNRSYGGQPFLQDLERLGFYRYFDPRSMAISADLGIQKPNPKIFEYALDGLHVAAEETAMVGDSLSADVYGAKQLNMFTVWKPKLHLRPTAQAELMTQHITSYTTQESSTARDAAAEPYPTLNNAQLLAYVQQHERPRNGYSAHHVQPDLIIEHIGDLLDTFEKAGKQ
jgi:FMN phosphatase YigB (HAD superfamily)